MRVQIVVSGLGGQGILFITRIFSALALQEGYPIIGSEDHGMSQRGGSVMTHLKIGEFSSPLIKKGDADILLSFEKNEALRTIPYLKTSVYGNDGGICFINASNQRFLKPDLMKVLNENGIEVFIFEADKLAKDMGMVQSTNIALIGFAAAHPRFPFSFEKLKQAIKEVIHPNFYDLNIKIFERSFAEGKRLMIH